MKKIYALLPLLLVGVVACSETPVASPQRGTSTSSTPTTSSQTPVAAPTTTTQPTTTPPVTTSAAPQYSPQVENARQAAQSYLDFTAFSRTGLINQLSSRAGDGFPLDVATEAVDSLGLDYNAEAAQSAQEYLRFESFSCAGLIEQLSSSAGSGYTQAQATYGAHQTDACK